MRTALAVFVTFSIGLAASTAQAQRVPFFAPAGTGYDPEISVVNTGQLLDAQAVVSDDLKYVTINARPSNSRLLALREFSFANGNRPAQGFVGGAGAALVINGQGGQREGAGRPRVNDLDRSGTTLVSRLDN